MPVILLPRRKPVVAVYSPLTAITDWAQAFWVEDPAAAVYAEGDRVNLWPNAGTEGSSFAATPATAPIMRVSGLNSKPTLEFTATTTTFRNTTGSAWTRPFSMVAIFQCTNTTSNRNVYDSASTGQRGNLLISTTTNWTIRESGSYGTGTRDTNRHIHFGEYNGTTSRQRLDNAAWVSGSLGAPPTASTGLNIGGLNTGSTPMVGYISFVGRVNRVLTTTEVSDLYNWASSYYGV